MTVQLKNAQSFMRTYARVLLDQIGAKAHSLTGQSRVDALAVGRKRLLAKRQVLESESIFLPEDEPQVRQAICGLVFARWVYLRDTTKYSIFLDPARKESYAVVGLTDPLAALFSGAGVSFEAGVCPLGDRFICDGLFVDEVYIGPNMRADFRSLHSQVARQGKFAKYP
jgi:hypothetical protein